MDYHYFTQPLPNPFSYYMAALPHWYFLTTIILIKQYNNCE